MLNSSIYKKYYPLKNIEDVKNIPSRDRNIIRSWVKAFDKDITYTNHARIEAASHKGANHFKRIDLNYRKDILSLYSSLTDDFIAISEFDSDDIDLLNAIIYRHKYIWLISIYVFPIKSTIARTKDIRIR